GRPPHWQPECPGNFDQERTMTTTRRNLALMLTVLAVGLNTNGPATAQSYPAKPIRFVVPFPAGGTTDVDARVIAEHLSRTLGQQVYVENRTGANGNIGVEAAAKSAPDGYTFLVAIDAVASNPHVYGTNIDPAKDLVPIVQLSRQPIVLAAHPSLGVDSLAELVVLAKQQPGLRYATGSGLGSPAHGGAMVCTDRWPRARTGAVPRRSAGD